MSDINKKKKDFKEALLACLLISKDGVALKHINKEFYDFMGYSIPYHELGYSDLEGLFRGLPDVVTLVSRNSEIFLCGKADPSTAHIAGMVQKQKPSAKAKNLSKQRTGIRKQQRKMYYSGYGMQNYKSHRQLSLIERSIPEGGESQGSEILPCAKTGLSTVHIEGMVHKQKSTEAKNRTKQRSRKRHKILYTGNGNQKYKSHAKPGLIDTSTNEGVVEQQLNLIFSIKANIQMLLTRYPEGLRTENFNSTYYQLFGVKLCWETSDYVGLEDLLMFLDNNGVLRMEKTHNGFKIFPMSSIMEELKAVVHFIKAFKIIDKPVIIQNCHSLISSPEVKKYLRSIYKLDQLNTFFHKYPTYFAVAKGIICLANPDLEDVELEAVSYFQGLLLKRRNRPLHVTNAQCFLNSKALEEFLNTKYKLSDLTPFFVRHCDIFDVNKGYIELKFFILDSSTDQEELSLTPNSSTSDVPHKTVPDQETEVRLVTKEQKKQTKALDKKAVIFFLNLIWRRKEAITTTLAHSFLGDNVDIREHLKKQFGLKDLQPFFQAHNQEFEIKGNLVFAKMPPPPSFVQSSNVKEENSGKPSPNVIKSGATKGKNVRILGPPPGIFTSTKVLTTKTPSTPSSGVLENTSSSSRVTRTASVASSENQKLLSHLMSLVMTTDASTSNLSKSPLTTFPQSSTRSKFVDAACQTVSSGPILSLNVFHELGKPS